MHEDSKASWACLLLSVALLASAYNSTLHEHKSTKTCAGGRCRILPARLFNDTENKVADKRRNVLFLLSVDEG